MIADRSVPAAHQENENVPVPFRNTEKALGPFMRAPSVVSIFERVEAAEAVVRELDAAGFGNELVYARGERALHGTEMRNQKWPTRVYRALQAVMSDELVHAKQYENKIADGASFILVPLGSPEDVSRVAPIIKSHDATYAHYLGRTGFRSL